MIIAQTTMIGVSLAILVYIAIVITGNLTTQNRFDKNEFLSQQSERDSIIREQISGNLNYFHKSDISQSGVTILLNGLTLHNNEFIPLYDSTPYAGKGHIELSVPCDESNPGAAIIQVLVGRAPDLTPMALGYVQKISSPPDMCIYHTQFGFGDPVTDVVLKNVSGKNVTFGGPHAAVISVHESYLPTAPSYKDIQHQKGY